MKRRHLLAALGAGVLTAPLAAFPQQPPKVPRIGFLSLDAAGADIGRQQQQFMQEALGRAGYRIGKDLVVEWRFSEGRVERLPRLAEELVRLRVDVIVAVSSAEATLAAMGATRTIPIVMHYFPGDPVERGVVASFARPGGNVTGTTYAIGDMFAKQYQLLKEAVPSAARVAALWRPWEPGSRGDAEFRERIRKTLGIVITDFHVSSPDEIPLTLQHIAAFKPDALYVLTDPVVRARLGEITAFAIEQRLVTIGSGVNFVRVGGLLYYGPDVRYAFGQTASLIDRILRGANPADLPVEQPTKYELVINAKTARAIGYKTPLALQMRVDRVIE